MKNPDEPTLRQKIALNLWPLDERGRAVKSLGEKLKSERKEALTWKKRALAAENRLASFLQYGKEQLREHDHENGTVLSWRVY